MSGQNTKPALPKCDWSGTKCKPQEFMEKFRGPEVVKLSKEDGGKLNLGKDVDVSKPFLVYSHRRRTKVYGQSVRRVVNGKKVEFKSTGTLFEIPKDYVGWFEVVPDDGTEPKHCTTINAIAMSGYHYFLTRTILCGFTVKENENDLELLEEHTIYPGEVLKVEKVCRKTWKTKDNKQDKKSPETAFLKCTDLKKNDICIPLAHPGKFSVLADDNSQNPDVVYQIRTVVENYNLPCVVRLAFGWSPPVSDAKFSGYLRLVETSRPDTMILYNFKSDDSVFLELPLDIDVRLQRAKNQEILDKSEAFNNALAMCKRDVFPYAISMKPFEVKVDNIKSEQKSGSSITAGLVANPRNMNLFSKSDIYPPLESNIISQTWSFSFKDPVHMKEGNFLSIEKMGESDDIDDGSFGRKSGPNKFDRKDSIMGTEEYSAEQVNIERLSRNADARASKYQEVKYREAKC